MTKPTAIDLFSGCGGLTLGLRRAGFRVLAAIENDRIAAATYRRNHRRVLVKRSDIRRVSAKGLRRELKLRAGQLALLAGCPPCQGFSVLRTKNGGRRNYDPRNNLVGQMLKFARAFRPKVVMMENVPDLANRETFRRLCAGLRRDGYEVAWKVKDAAMYGVPQRRRRLILLAARDISVPFAHAGHRQWTVRNVIGRMPKAGKSGDWLHDIPERHRSEKVIRLIRDIPKDGGSRSDLGKRRQLRCHKKCNGFGDVYGRMAWDKVAPTITSGCFNPSKGRFLHPAEHRAITMREAALLQTFPRLYSFPRSAGKEAIALMIGNALPPEFIRRHARQIALALKVAKRKPRRRSGRVAR